jgi:LacI family transcriptional regulator
VDRTAVNEVENVSIPVEYLLASGHRRIAYFGHVPGRSAELFSTRRRAYERCMEEHGLRVYREFFEIPDAIDVPSGVKVRQILALWRELGSERPTALILADFHALHLLQQAQAQGIRIPGQLSVIGIDNVSYGELSAPRLTSMHQPFEEMGKIAVELMLSRLKEPARLPRLMLVGPQLVRRDSVAPPESAGCGGA